MKLSKEAREARREYMKKYREQNPDKQKVYAARYWERRAERERKAEQEEE